MQSTSKDQQRNSGFDFKVAKSQHGSLFKFIGRRSNGKLSEALSKLVLSAPAEKRDNYQEQFEDFKKVLERFIFEQQFVWERIKPIPSDDLLFYDQLGEPEIMALQDNLRKLVVIRMYGSSSSAMGCEGPRYLLTVHDGLSFLDLCVLNLEFINETYDTDIPLVLMLSYHTKKPIEKMLTKFKDRRVKIYTFEQHTYPKIYKDSFMPVETDLKDPNPEAWYPAGHGDFYRAFSKSNLLQNFINDGKEICFLAKGDNLGATVDFKILNLLASPLHTMAARPRFEFLMELTPKTETDTINSTLIKYDGEFQLLEAPFVPDDHKGEFTGIKKFKYFNCNNLWITLKSIYALSQRRGIYMDVSCKYTKLSDGKEVMQLERAVGSAIQSFKDVCGIIVPRSRFQPVKSATDLLLIKSNLFGLKNGTIVMNPKRTSPELPQVKLDKNYFQCVEDCFSRFMNIPDLVDLEELVVLGDVKFRSDIVLKGKVFIVAEEGESIDIPDGAILENKFLSGNLKIDDV